MNQVSAVISDTCREKEGSMEYFCPTVRYCDWNSNPGPTRRFARQRLGYKMNSWNFLTVNTIEQTAFEELAVNIQKNLMQLGYQEDEHDCCQGHYESYDWFEFEDDEDYSGTLAALELLGYDEDKWTNDLVTEYDDYWWDELPEDVQFALSDELCYSKELWNEVPSNMWGDDVMLPGSYLVDETEEEEEEEVEVEEEEEEEVEVEEGEEKEEESTEDESASEIKVENTKDTVPKNVTQSKPDEVEEEKP